MLAATMCFQLSSSGVFAHNSLLANYKPKSHCLRLPCVVFLLVALSLAICIEKPNSLHVRRQRVPRAFTQLIFSDLPFNLVHLP